MEMTNAAGQPIVEVDGKIMFGLPGKPIFDLSIPKGFLKPTLLWRLWTDQPGAHQAEFSYMTGACAGRPLTTRWRAEKGNTLEPHRLGPLENMCGKDFEEASVKLMAATWPARLSKKAFTPRRRLRQCAASSPSESVTERAFDEVSSLYLAASHHAAGPRGQTGRVRACRQCSLRAHLRFMTASRRLTLQRLELREPPQPG